MSTGSLSLAVVLPRYGESLGGGAETLTKSLVEELRARGHLSHLEVWTTCAADHRTWENFHPPGVSVEKGITVRRFSVDARDLEVFIRAEHALQDGRGLSVDEQLAWLRESVNSRDLYSYIAVNGRNFDALLFAPYLFATSFWGSLIHPDRSIVIPCLHDEHYAYQPVFKALFSQVRGIFFNSAPEQQLARELYALRGLDAKSVVVGMGFDQPQAVSHPPENRGRYLLYSGRKEQGKNLDLLIENYSAYRAAYPGDNLSLLLIGSGSIGFLSSLPDGVVDLGFVSESEKSELMAGAVALCQPSRNESFSIVLMESWLQGTPVVVHGQCPVTRHHVTQSGGGLYFTNREEFIRVIRLLSQDASLQQEMGKSGHAYVRREYNWDIVCERALAGFEKFGLLQQAHQTQPHQMQARQIAA